MRFYLMPLYRLGAWLAGLSMLAIVTLITAQVLSRALDRILVAVGHAPLGWTISGVSEIAGFLLVGATFLGSAYTFATRGHIRVTLVTERLPLRIRVLLEVVALTLALVLTGYLGIELWVLLEDSIAYNEVSYGLVAIPLVYPQAVLVSGIALLALAIAETLLNTVVLGVIAPHRLDAPLPEQDSVVD
ncbi:TRAP transporter small permease [Larsenimonas salina]|uniref:TRAP transporter small permease n=1 Tax=Larsenimonas salina TaxID=1295565 RepID=UPI002073DF82|nr:TRAP transporter small permease [Larsenimonas salina]MCM5703759.1 TRAP transporter small permease [Larsenimonas salina]